jgi:CheY-like chemotaxis protein
MRLRLLIVDDNVHFLRAARALLEREGLDIAAVASTADDAVRRSAEVVPDAVLVDVDLGDESGFDVAQRLAEVTDAPVILVSAYPEQDFAELVSGSTAIGFLSKSRLCARDILEMLDGASR